MKRSLLPLKFLRVDLEVLELPLIKRILNVSSSGVVQETFHEYLSFVVELRAAKLVRNLPLPVELDEEVVGKLLGLVSTLGLHIHMVEEYPLQIVVVLILIPIVIIILLLILIIIRVIQLVTIVITILTRAAPIFIIILLFSTEALRLKFSLSIVALFALDSCRRPLRDLTLQTPLRIACILSPAIRGSNSLRLLLRGLG